MKIDKLDCIKIKNVCIKGHSQQSKKIAWEAIFAMGGNICQLYIWKEVYV